MLVVPQEKRKPQGKGIKKTVHIFLAVTEEGTLNIIKSMKTRT